MTAEWKQLVVATLKARGMTKADLADTLGVSRGAITQMLGPTQPSSVLVPKVCKALGIPAPVVTDDVEFAQIVQDLLPEQRRILLDLARQLLKKTS
jgi:transcriptional regulator with XRE-family HTH domain